MRDSMEALIVDVGLASENDDLIVTGALHGLASLYRRTASQYPPAPRSLTQIAARTVRPNGPMTRRLAMAALVASGRADARVLETALGDPEREVRRLAGLAAFAQPDLAGRDRVINAAWTDPEPAVRYEAVRANARHSGPKEGCARTLSALNDQNLHVRILAIDLLGACGNAAAPKLVALARGRISAHAWHLPAHAIVALAQADSGAALTLLPRFVSSGVWWARMYAARAAESLHEVSELRRLARDREPNVSEAALAGLHRKVGHAADSLYILALDAGDYQLIQTAATALDSSPDPRAVPALWKAFARLTAEKRETSRDPRMAILASIERIDSRSLATELRETASDFDSTVAATAARLASRWSATNISPTPKPLPRAPVPSWTDLQRWSRMTAEITMRNGGVIRMKLRPFDAPTNVARFASMVNRGWFDGLTWHRVVPNFVVQGGSPGANEFMGDGPFTRDELGLEHHVRGTVGISTRGRDTGDGQLFFNLIDNWRLDHDYTIIGEVVSGMEVVDAMQEGAVIQRVTLIPDKS
jgi:cyclophilin family peptidyl-prolyl cis-trans isomerase